MDHSLVQQILDNANTRGTAILMRTVREMIKDRKTILVALVSLLPIILGLLWSNYLSEDEDIEGESYYTVGAYIATLRDRAV